MIRWRPLARRGFRKLWFDKRRAKYHFIHIPKNAGESVRHALFLQRDVSLSTPFHYRYVDVVDRAGRDLSYFAIIRNPWSRTASRYQFARQNALQWASDDPRRQYICRASFADYVRDRKIFEIPEHPGQPWMGPMNSWFNQLEWIRDHDGRIACDCLRMESLNEDLNHYLGRILKLQRRNVTHTGYDYRTLYTDDLAEVVRDVFREDIAHFGFTFEGPATRNVFAGH
jgi:hypothetical protein